MPTARLSSTPTVAGELLRRHLRARVTVSGLSQELTWSPRRARQLVRSGYADPIALAADIGRIMPLTEGLSKAQVMQALFADVGCRSDSLPGRILTKLVETRTSLDRAAVVIGVQRAQLDRMFTAVPPTLRSADRRARFAKWLGITEQDLKGMLQAAEQRRRAPTAILSQVNTLPLSEHINATCSAKDLSLTQWSRDYKFREKTIRILASGGQWSVTGRLMTRLASALGLDETTAWAALRLNVPYPTGSAPGLQELIQREIDGGMTFAKLEEKWRVRDDTIARILRSGSVAGVHSVNLYRLRQGMSLDLDAYRAAFRPMRRSMTKVRSLTSATLTTDEDVVLLRLWNRASAAVKARVIEILGGKTL